MTDKAQGSHNWCKQIPSEYQNILWLNIKALLTVCLINYISSELELTSLSAHKEHICGIINAHMCAVEELWMKIYTFLLAGI